MPFFQQKIRNGFMNLESPENDDISSTPAIADDKGKKLKAYLDEIGVDLSEVESLEEIAEVFPLADGTYLIVEA